MVQDKDAPFSLSAYAGIIAKHKAVVLIIVIVSVVTSLIITMRLPRIYDVSMTIDPPLVGRTNDGYPIHIEAQDVIAGKVSYGAFDDEIKKDLGPDAWKGKLQFFLFNPPDTKLLRISLKAEEKDREKAVQILNTLYDVLYKRYEKTIDARSKEITDLIEKTQAEIHAVLDKVLTVEDSFYERYNAKKWKRYALKELIFLRDYLVIIKEKNIHNIALVNKPKVSKRPIGPDVKANLIFSFIISLCAGIAAAFFIEYWKPFQTDR
ncbi:MAG: hypothetical protein PHI58_06990 [Candidatus Omnitrophica bacterium]|nr:hypothetical protein [Candidatus Omnitrophota bacterium]